MDVASIMRRDVPVAAPNDTVAHIRRLFLRYGISYIIVGQNRPVGIITDTDIAHALSRSRRPIDEIKAEQIMSRRLITIPPTATPEEAAQVMVENDCYRLPVEEGGRIVGILTKDELVAYFGHTYRGRVSVAQLVSKAPTLKPFQSVFQAEKIMRKAHCSKAVVIHDGRIVGIITDYDLSLATFGVKPSAVVMIRKSAKGMSHRSVRLLPLVVADIMQKNVQTISPSEDAAKAARRMVQKGIGCLVVEKDGQYIGLITKTDCIKWLAHQAKGI